MGFGDEHGEQRPNIHRHTQTQRLTHIETQTHIETHRLTNAQRHRGSHKQSDTQTIGRPSLVPEGRHGCPMIHLRPAPTRPLPLQELSLPPEPDQGCLSYFISSFYFIDVRRINVVHLLTGEPKSAFISHCVARPLPYCLSGLSW